MIALLLAATGGVPVGLPAHLGRWNCEGVALASGSAPVRMQVDLRWKKKWDWLVNAAQGEIVATSDRRFSRGKQHTVYSADPPPAPMHFDLGIGDDRGSWVKLNSLDLKAGRASFKAGHQEVYGDVVGIIDDYTGECELIK